MSVLFWMLFVISVHNVISEDIFIKPQKFSAQIDIEVDDSSRVHIRGQAGKPGRVTCYFTNWAVYREGNASYSVDDIPYNKCTHLVYAFVGLSNTTFELSTLDPANDVEDENFLKFVKLRDKNPNLTVGVAMGGWAEGGRKYSEMVNDPRKRCNFTRSVTNFMQLYNFDSFDLDWEYPGASERDGIPSDKLAYLLLIRELRHSFDMVNPKLEITIAVPVAIEHIRSGYYVRELCQIVNAVHLMAYDLRTVGDYKNVTYENADSHTPLYRRRHDKGIFKHLNVHDGVMLWVNEGCSRDKLVVGTAFYGRSFNLSDVNRTRPGEAPIDAKLGQGDPAEFTQEAGYIAYFEICERLQRGNESSGEGKWVRGYDEEGRVPYTYFKNNWIGYENKESMQVKMDWIKKEGFAGAMNWAIDLDDWKGRCGEKDVMIDVLRNAMENYTVPEPPAIKDVSSEKLVPISLLENSWICYDFQGGNLTESLNLFLP